MVYSTCGEKGHNKQTCPLRVITVGEVIHNKTRKKKNTKKKEKIDSSNIIYLLFGLETTGFSRNYHDIVELYALLTTSKGITTNLFSILEFVL